MLTSNSRKLVNISRDLNSNKFRVRNTKTYIDYLVLRAFSHDVMGFPKKFTVVNLEDGCYEELEAYNHSYILLSDANEISSIRNMTEHDVILIFNKSYNLKYCD